MPRSRSALVAVATSITVALVATVPAGAAPTTVLSRVEGRSATLFEGPILADGHAIRAASDARGRRCDGTNNGAHPTAGPTPTATAVDGMAIAGQDFDAKWYPGFDDYFLTRLGPDFQSEDDNAYWGILVNGVYTSVGGCQYRLNAADLALWVYDAFNERPVLRLDGPTGIGEPTAAVEGGPSTAPVRQSFTVDVGQPLAVHVVGKVSSGEVGGAGGYGDQAGVGVSPVATAANGFQTVLRSDPATKITGADGRTTLSWSTPGWKRIKAERAGAVRSNRLDVCVRAPGQADCGPLPADARTRTPPPPSVPEPPKDSSGGGGGGSLVDGPGESAPVAVGDVRLSAPRITADGNPTGLVGVRWEVLSAGSGLRSWTIESRLRGVRGARWTRQASGTTQTTALLDLPIARTSQLRVRFVAASGRTSLRTVGEVVVPRDDRVRQLRFGGRLSRVADPRAWRLTVTRLSRGATLRTRLAAGRPTLVVRAARRAARIELRVGRRVQRLTVPGRRDGRTIFVSGRRRTAAGEVRVRVLSGTVAVDGVAARP
ncbi:hypothetical protein PAI11_19770 [Patulibacter medicamentivorans]|uniref:DUF4430 domain-containing protein n=1 Tax=Patulibacter medicamentivorans TaxID=1097667 RepID=H0E587_9ACTN|nr:hypothetical protein [Patulibacter medicamentivorans]EHN11157.1 hypothetical protein PAI11_19770 [Patulibacter medicamentivorans]